MHVTAERLEPTTALVRISTSVMSEFDEATRKQILAVLCVGGSLRDAAHYIGVPVAKLRELRQIDIGFDCDIRKARARSKINPLFRIAKASQWQAARFLLEHLWPDPFKHGRRKKNRSSVTGATWAEAAERLSVEELELLRDLLRKAEGIQPGPPTAAGDVGG